MKRFYIIMLAALLCIGMAGCKRQDNSQSSTPDVSEPALAQNESPLPDDVLETDEPTQSIEPIIELADADLILSNSDFEGLEKPEGYKVTDEDRAAIKEMVDILRVTNDAMIGLDELEQEDDEYLLNAKAPIIGLMDGIKDAHEEGMTLDYPESLEEFHKLYMSVLILNYNGADLMAQSMDSDDNELAEEAYRLFDQSGEQYSYLIDYANLLLGNPVPSDSTAPTGTAE